MCIICDSQEFNKITCCSNVIKLPLFLNNNYDLSNLERLDCSNSKIKYM